MLNKHNILSFKCILLLLLALSLFSASCDKPDNTRQRPQQSNALTGPIIDSGIQGGSVMEKLELDGKSPESLAQIGDQYFESGRYIQAIDIYRRVLELNPKDADTYNDLGLALHYTGQSIEAVSMFKKGAEADPNYQNIWLSLGYVLAQSGRNEEAKSALQTAVDLNPNSLQGQEAGKMIQTIN